MQQKQPQMKAKRSSKVQRLSLDRISTLPQTIIETILCLLPIEEAARTSILSREWRFKWTTIPKLVFSYSTVERPSSENRLSLIDWDKTHDSWRCKLFYAIHQVLLLHQGPIHEFTLDADDNFFEIDQIILHLSRNHTLKKLTLGFCETGVYKLPSSVFSLHHLMDLDLEWCDIDHKQIFNGSFGSLTSLSLREIRGYEDGDETEPDKLEEQSRILEEYSDVWLEHLKELEIKLFGNRKPELEFMKFILARSPNLKKVELQVHMYDKKEELEMTKTLLRTPRASPVEIIVHNSYQV
ncbi:putative FBD domain, leucine-rich repeat domain superfamily, F-box-like domain superfamily [Helianthus anomalus]